LPDTSVLSLADVLHTLAFVFIFLTLAEPMLSLRFDNGGDDGGRRKSKMLDHWSFAVLLTVYVGLSAAVAWY
jgi:hypothetical protein